MDKRLIMSIHDKAIRLLEGGIVDIEGNWFGLIRLSDDLDNYYDSPCVECTLDSICKEEHKEVCSECDTISGGNCCLRLAHIGR